MSLTLNEKIYGLSLIWKEAEYNSPFWKRLPDLDWDAEYQKALQRVIEIEDIREYYLELMKFIYLLKDAHTDVFMPERVKENIGFYLFHLKYIDGNHYIDYIDRKYNIKPYSKIIKINDIEINKYIETELLPYCWHEKLESIYNHFNFLICWLENGKDLKIETENEIFIAERVFYDHNNPPNYTGGFYPECNDEFTKEIFSSNSHVIKSTDDNIIYIKLPNFSNYDLLEQFAANIDKINDCRGFIIDLRDNGGGGTDIAFPIAQYFFNESIPNYAKDRKMIHIGTYKAYGQWCKGDEELRNNVDEKTYDICKRQYFEEQYFSFNKDDNSIYLNQPVVILTNENTMSAAEDFLILFKNRRAMIIGTNSFGSTGMGIYHTLPGGGSFRICTRWCAYANDEEYLNIGIEPDIYAHLSLDDYLNFNDSVLRKGLGILREDLSNSTR